MYQQSVKLYAWEYAFSCRILHIRNDLELKILQKTAIAKAASASLWSAIPAVVSFSSLAATSVFLTRPLTADVIFPAISLFMLLQFPLLTLTQAFTGVVEALVSAKRISNFLGTEEVQRGAVRRIERNTLSIGDEVLSIKDGDFRWTKHGDESVLEGINLSVQKGELLGILGRVGAGKSSLLSAIIGDMWKMKGKVALSCTVAYAAQNPWILSTTIRDNILFSHVYDESFYNLVIEACGLRPDLAVLPQGDMTEVGERGITLSGGQRARVALARAVYARADLVLLDDVLAAVDPEVARGIFNDVIGPQGLLATKARILITNNITYLEHFDQLAYIRRGVIIECGSYQQLISNPKNAVYRLIHNHIADSSSLGGASGDPATPLCSNQNETNILATNCSSVQATAEKVNRRTSFSKAAIAPLPSAHERMSFSLPKEHSERKGMKENVYLRYIQAASRKGFCFSILASVLQQVVSIMSTFMLRMWAKGNHESGKNVGLKDPYLLASGFCDLTSILLSAAAGLSFWAWCSLRCSKHLHNLALDSILKAPLSFFEQTPSGRILNLFTRDIYVIDEVLGKGIRELVRTCITTVSVLLVIGFSFPLFMIAIIPLSWFYYRVTLYYLSTSRALKRLDASAKSPVLTWFTESLVGLSTIRAYNQQAIFTAQNARRIDRSSMCYFPSISVNRWLAIRLEFVGSVIILLVATLAVSSVTSNIDPGLAGMALTYALNIANALSQLVRAAVDIEQKVVCVERIMHYANDLPSEIPRRVPRSKLSVAWPNVGGIEFRKYSMKYRPELDPVLKEISLIIKPKERIGIVGRTGAGKSSLLLALFRILEAASGKIYIDGVDIGRISLYDLRSRISIVPQSPDMFEGTLRENVDPVGEHQDADIWVALEHAHLKSYVESLPGGLDAPVQEGGSSLSAGQKQLLCFARALLRKTKILVLDEATSAVDLDTDRAVQDIIRGPVFKDMTILTIAHRLNTIIDSTRILVLDNGRVAEFDAPAVLLADKSGKFYSMAMEAGLVQDEVRIAF